MTFRKRLQVVVSFLVTDSGNKENAFLYANNLLQKSNFINLQFIRSDIIM